MMKKKLKTVFVIFILSACVLGFSGCGETVRGAGRDLTRIGRGIKTVFVAD